MKKIFIIGFLFVFSLSSIAQEKTVQLKVVETSDVHGCFFPYDFINLRNMYGSLARAMTYIRDLRKEYGENVILLDNGDILQGQPVCYYTNYVATEQPNIIAEITNYMGYDAQTIGNHDIETGHEVYDKWIRETQCPVLGANILNTATGKPYTPPYTILKRDGIKIAIIGLTTPAIPNWLNEYLWSGMQFEEMVSSAKKWIKVVKEQEKADIVIGLFHSGKEGGITTEDYEEDASLRIAREVDGFDIVFFGHDHRLFKGKVTNSNGDSVLCLNPANRARYLAEATITLKTDGKKHPKISSKSINGKLVDLRRLPADEEYMNHFVNTIAEVKNFVERPIGKCREDIFSRESFFGPAAFTDMIHDLQLEKTGADISFNAPLVFDTKIAKGDIKVSDLFNLYRFENRIYVLKMTGEEIRRHLEMSYDLWVNTMKSPDDHIMLLDKNSTDDNQRSGFKNMTFNFDSAAGIDYVVDVTKEDGQKVKILQMSDGTPFDAKKWYKVVMNSYRGNGGGELLTRGAGLSKEEIKERIIWQSDKDQRFYLMQMIERQGNINPQAHNNWRFIPEEWAAPAIERDRKILFKEENK